MIHFLRQPQELFAVFAGLLQKADETLEQTRKSPLTHDIKRLDTLRDSVFRALKATWKYALAEINPVKCEAAERLGVVLHHLGNLAAKPYNEATAGLANFLQELRGKYASEVELLNLTELANKLEETNNAFEATLLQRNAEASARPEMKMIELRHDINRRYLDMIERIEAQALLEGDEHFDGFIRTLNANIERYKNARRSLKKKDEATGSNFAT